MKPISQSSSVFILRLVLAAAFILSVNNAFSQLLSNDELYERGATAYNRGFYQQAAIYLFAYLQRDPPELNSNKSFSRQVNSYYQTAMVRSKTPAAGADGKSDDVGNRGVPPQPRDRMPAAKPTSAGSNSFVKSGTYTCNDAGTYNIRIVNNEVWWYGVGTNNAFTNVMHGTIAGDRINGEWADVPPGSSRNAGKITLRIVNDHALAAVAMTGGFSGSIWQLQTGAAARRELPSKSKAE